MTNAKEQWLSVAGHAYKLGQVGFLIRRQHKFKRWIRWHLQRLPAITNQSRQEILRGKAGITNYVRIEAYGLARIVLEDPDAGLLLACELDGNEERDILKHLGYFVDDVVQAPRGVRFLIALEEGESE